MQPGDVHLTDEASAAGRAIRSLTVLGMTVALGMLALGGVVLLDARQDAWQQAEQSVQNLVIALERDISHTISTYDLSLRGAVEALQQPGIESVAPAIRHTAIFDRAASADYLGSLLVLDATGAIAEDSTSIVPHALDLVDRDYFQVHRDQPAAGLFVSRPFNSRLRAGDASIAISRRLPDTGGQFNGVVVGTLRIAYFRDLFSRLDLGTAGAVSLARTDGVPILRQPPAPAAAEGLQRQQQELIRRFRIEPAGSFVGPSAVDGLTRLFTYRQVGALPLVIAVALSVDDIYAAWWRKAVGIGSILAVLCGATIVLCVLFRRELLRRLRAERALMETAEKLAVMAATDEMTGLANRRAFEAEIDQEWRRAVRNETPLALLMLDADWFKSYNDRYGHQAGDDALRKIAACIQENIRRPGDIGARYGGEEFVALLPDTGHDGAINTASRISASLATLAIPHDACPTGKVTLSIGIAVMPPGSTETDQALLRRADQALYEAKRTGRARICIAPAQPRPATATGTAAIEPVA